MVLPEKRTIWLLPFPAKPLVPRADSSTLMQLSRKETLYTFPTSYRPGFMSAIISPLSFQEHI